MPRGRSSAGRAAVSKTAGRGFESCRPCQCQIQDSASVLAQGDGPLCGRRKRRNAMDNPYTAAPDIEVLPSTFEIPGYGLLAINAFVLKGKEPLLVDTGYTLENAEFMDTLRSVIDPKDLKWVWLTHTDHDHIGSLHQLLDEVPDLRVITTFLAVGKMNLHNPLPMDRVYFLNPGESMSVGDRTLSAVKPQPFNAPDTTGFYDVWRGGISRPDLSGALMPS